MKPTWLIERGVYREHEAAFADEVERQGMDCAFVDYQPGREPPGDILGSERLAADACVVLWGTLPLMRQIQLRRQWVPGGWCNIANLDCATYYAYFGPYLLNDYYSILPGVEAIRLRDRLFDEFGRDDEIFVRPSGVHKLFTGKAVYRDDFCDAVAPSRYDPTTLIVVSAPQELGREWRLVVAGSEIVASSQYRYDGAIAVSPGAPAEVLAFGKDTLRSVPWRPDNMFIMDVCESGGRLRLLELNSLSCSGLYACDLVAVVSAASAAAVEEWNNQRAAGRCDKL